MTTNEQYGFGDIAHGLVQRHCETKARKIAVPLSEVQRWTLFALRCVFLTAWPAATALRPWVTTEVSFFIFILGPIAYILMVLCIPPWQYFFRYLAPKTETGTLTLLLLSWIGGIGFTAWSIIPFSSPFNVFTVEGYDYGSIIFVILWGGYQLLGGFVINPWWPIYPHKHILINPPKVQHAS